MLDINFIRNNQKLVEHSAKSKGYKINLSQIFELDDTRKSLNREVDELRSRRNTLADVAKKSKPTPEAIAEGKEIKAKLSELEPKLTELESTLTNLLKSVPNIIFDDVPLGGEEDSVEVKHWGEKSTKGQDHLDYAMSRNWIDFERGAKVAGAKFYYLKNELVLLEQALIQYALNKLYSKNFIPMSTPDMVSSKVLEGTGFNPRTSDQSDEYFIEGEDLALIATAEIPLTGFHMNEIIDEKDLPFFYAGISPCFRKEAGAAGKHTRGLFRVHQFNKVEMYVFCTPEDSKKIHEQLLDIEQEIWQELNIPYRIINIAAGDLGAPAAKKYDIEYWSPVDQTYREITSCSNCTDFQAKGLNIRVRRDTGEIAVVHTLNGTAISLARALVAIIENAEIKDGKMVIPPALRPYTNNQELL